MLDAKLKFNYLTCNLNYQDSKKNNNQEEDIYTSYYSTELQRDKILEILR